MTIVEILTSKRDDENLSPEARTAINEIFQIIRDEKQFKELADELYIALLQGDGWDKEDFIN